VKGLEGDVQAKVMAAASATLVIGPTQEAKPPQGTARWRHRGGPVTSLAKSGGVLWRLGGMQVKVQFALKVNVTVMVLVVSS